MQIRESYFRRYLLGDLPQDENKNLEVLLSADADLRDALLSFKDDLFDDYARGKLSPAEATAFESCLLSSESDCAELEFSQVLARYVRRTRPVSSRSRPTRATVFARLPRFAFSAGLIVLLVSVVSLWVRTQILQRRWQSASAEVAQLRGAADAPVLTRSGTPDSAQNSSLKDRGKKEQQSASPRLQLEATVFLVPPGVRSADSHDRVPTLVLRRGLATVRFLLPFHRVDQSVTDFYADIVDVDMGRSVFRDSHLEVAANSKGSFAILRVPSRSIRTGVYKATLFYDLPDHPGEVMASYSFVVTR
jgi:hypothetical protein